MNTITIESLAWTLVHSLWQAAIAGAFLWLLLRQMPAQSVTRRYGLAISAMVIVVLGAMVTLAILSLPTQTDQAASIRPTESVYSGVSGGTPAVSITPGRLNGATATAVHASPIASNSNRGNSTSFDLSRWEPTVVWIWLAGVGIMLCRVIAALRGARKLIDQAEPCNDAPVLELLERLSDTLGLVRRVTVKIHATLRVPAVVGILKPVILLPASAMTGMSPDQWEAVLLHELAHVRRNDLLVQIGQMLIEAMFFFNPAVWWISRQVRIERESCADHAATRVLGEPDRYVQVLADWAQRLLTPDPSANPTSTPIAAAAMALTGPQRSGTLLDRAKRLLIPGYRPKVRLPWHTLMGMLVICPLLLIGLWRGTNMAVLGAAKVLSPQERIEAIQQVQQTHGDPSEQSIDPNATSRSVTLTGDLLMEDGSEVPDHLILTATAYSKSMTTTISLDYKDHAGGHFSSSVLPRADSYTLGVSGPGIAPAISGPLKLPPGGNIVEGVQIVLSRGFASTIRIEDPDGKPLAGASVKHVYMVMTGSITSYLSSAGPTESDDKGEILLPNAVDLPLKVMVRAAGYQSEQFTFKPSADVHELKLRPAHPTTGTVVDQSTGKPIAGAVIRLVQGTGQDNYGPFDPKHMALMATTDQQGNFKLDSLADGVLHMLRIDAADHGPELLFNVSSGTANLTWKMGPPRILKGRITDGLDQLEKANGKPGIWYTMSVQMGEHSSYENGYIAQVQIEQTAAGPVGVFQTENLLPGTLNIERIEVTPPIRLNTLSLPAEPLELNLHKSTEKANHAPKREVIFRVVVPTGLPAAQGTLHLDYLTTNNTHGYSNAEVFPLKDGEVHLSVPVPTKVMARGENITGYWVPQVQGIEIAATNAPQIIELPAYPAGAIYGRILAPDGSPVQRVDPSVIVIDRPDFPGNPNLDLNNLHVQGPSSDGKFVISPLPLGGVYRVTASQGECRVIGEAMKLDDASPLQQVELKLVEGVTVNATVVDEAGQPVIGVPISLLYDSPWRHSFGSAGRQTDSNGQFVLEHVNPDLPGKFSLVVKPSAKLRGNSVEFTPGKNPVKIVLKKGLHLEGTVIDVSTGKPLANAMVHANSDPYSTEAAETATDSEGRFVLDNLDDSEYWITVEHTWAEGTTTFQKDGNTWYRSPGQDVNHFKPQADPVQVRVTTNPPPKP